jgi:hypothetical protein
MSASQSLARACQQVSKPFTTSCADSVAAKGDLMRLIRLFPGVVLSVVLMFEGGTSISQQAAPAKHATTRTSNVAVGPQYDTTHVYVAVDDYDRFVASLIATFGGTTSKQVLTTVIPTPSSTISQLVLTPAGTISVFGFKTPIPYPFGAERTGYLVTDLDAAIRMARSAGADLVVTSFNDPVGKDAVIQLPGSVNTQIYIHSTPPSYKPLETIPENRVYVSPDRAAAFIHSFLAFSHGTLTSDDKHAPGGHRSLRRLGSTHHQTGRFI